MVYKEALNYIKNIARAGSDYGIERMRELLVLLGEPDRALKFVHVAGTNGKGSVCAYITSILREAGYCVGTYNSPSVFCYNERWLVDGVPLSDDEVAKYISEVRDAIDRERRMRPAFSPTAFEIETAVAFIAFKDRGTDICVLETGLGGRWDATNVIYDKLLSVITPIGLDHCALLGDTIEEIASEKAAIIDGDAVTCPQSEEALCQLRRPYALRGGERLYKPCSLTICSPVTPVSDSLDGQEFEYDGERYFIKMLGSHQSVNASLAIEAAKILNKKGFEIDANAIRRGLKNTLWRARLQVLKPSEHSFGNGILVLDGAHNPHGAAALRDALIRYFPGKKVGFVLGILADKDVEGILQSLLPLASKAVAITPPSPRALAATELIKLMRAHGTMCSSAVSAEKGISDLMKDCEVVVLCGSLTIFENLGGIK